MEPSKIAQEEEESARQEREETSLKPRGRFSETRAVERTPLEGYQKGMERDA